MRSNILTIVVTYNAMLWTERCLNSLKESTVKPDVIIIDNGSSDGTQLYIKKNYPDIIFIPNKENLGFGKANNLGLQYALDHDYDFVYLLNQDAWVMPNTFECLIEISKRYPEYGILSPFQMNADLQHIDQGFITRVCSWDSNSDIFNDFYNQSVSELYPVKVIMAAHWFMTRECVQKVGGFSPTFPHYGEDDNYAERVHYWNFKMGVVPSLRVVHDRGDRVVTNKYQIHQCYINALIALSKPNETFKEKWKSLWANLKLAVRCKSFQPIINLFKILCNLKRIERNLQISITQPCAFLDSALNNVKK